MWNQRHHVSENATSSRANHEQIEHAAAVQTMSRFHRKASRRHPLARGGSHIKAHRAEARIGYSCGLRKRLGEIHWAAHVNNAEAEPKEAFLRSLTPMGSIEGSRCPKVVCVGVEARLRADASASTQGGWAGLRWWQRLSWAVVGAVGAQLAIRVPGVRDASTRRSVRRRMGRRSRRAVVNAVGAARAQRKLGAGSAVVVAIVPIFLRGEHASVRTA